MIRESLLWVSEALFWLLDGEMLLNTPWFIVWVFISALLVIVPVYFCSKISTWAMYILFPFYFFAILLIMQSPGAIQAQLMQECQSIKVVIKDQDVVLRECRKKENYYDDFGAWAITEMK